MLSFSVAILKYTCLSLFLYVAHLISLLIERVVSHIGGGRHKQLLLHTHCTLVLCLQLLNLVGS